MPNTLTNLIPDAYKALDVVSQEPIGVIGSVVRDAAVDQLAIGQNIRSVVVPTNVTEDIVPAMAFPAANYQNIGSILITLTKARKVKFSWTGEEQYAVDKGPGILSIEQDQIAQGMRVIRNEMETDLVLAMAAGGSRAWGTAGVTPLGTNLAEIAQLKKILDDNGAPMSDRHLALNSATVASSLTLTQLTNANQSGSTDPLRRGVLLDIFGFELRQAKAVPTLASGTGSGYLVNNAGPYPVGTTSLTLDTGTGTILAGDVVTIGNNKYVVNTALTANTLILNLPGLVEPIADNATVTVNAASARNLAFTRNSAILAARLPKAPSQGDLAIMREVLTDPVTGISYQMAVFPGYQMVTIEIQAVWGVKVLKSEHIAELLG